MRTKYFSIITLCLSTLFFASCGQNSSDQTNTSATDSVPVIETEEPHVHEPAEPIVLDNGKKWKVDDHMLAWIRQIETEVYDFTADTQTQTLKMYHQLASNISTNLDSLTSNCTMTGQAHDELHKWLLPFLDMSDHFSASETLKEADSIYHSISASFMEFNIYFE
ncbi:MAG: hypothetical protein IPM74_10080 [Crocinitomicaceae bacterium]|nr:hypothetical protein [Crocinitomicaceae bacterium]MBK8926240.1 hypothetical protein [Crocinitomicaceae bacterium]